MLFVLLVKEVAARWGTVEAVSGGGGDAGDGHGGWRAPVLAAQPRRLALRFPMCTCWMQARRVAEGVGGGGLGGTWRWRLERERDWWWGRVAEWARE